MEAFCPELKGAGPLSNLGGPRGLGADVGKRTELHDGDLIPDDICDQLKVPKGSRWGRKGAVPFYPFKTFPGYVGQNIDGDYQSGIH